MPKPHIELICVGTELLSGKVNTHTSYIGRELMSHGFQLMKDHTVGDHPQLMLEVFKNSYKNSDVILCAGGLGPTFDDITREIWSKVLKQPLVYQSWIVDEIKDKFKKRGLSMPPHNKRQGFLLKKAQFIRNNHGTAPGQWITAGHKIVVLLPGPGRELFPMFEDYVMPHLNEKYSKAHQIFKSFHLVGVAESIIDHSIRPIVNQSKKLKGCQVDFGILASHAVITVKFLIEGKSLDVVRKTEQKLSSQIRKRIGRYLFGEDNDQIQFHIGKLLSERKKTVSLAESCTGGLISKLLTDQPGASDYLMEGVVTYSNESKIRRCGVKPQTLIKWGAVSKQTAHEMAHGLRKKTKTDFTLSITGIAGPTGGSTEKPVGTVFIGCAGPKSTVVVQKKFKGSRDAIRERSSVVALDFLRQQIQKQSTSK